MKNKPYDVVYVCGPNIPIEPIKAHLQAAKEHSPAFNSTIIGDGKRLVTAEEIQAADKQSNANSEWFINAHGIAKGGEHYMHLLAAPENPEKRFQRDDPNLGRTEETLGLLHNAKNVHLTACHAGAAISACRAAPQGAALFPHAAEEEISMFNGQRMIGGLIHKHADELKQKGDAYKFDPAETHAWAAARSIEPTGVIFVDKSKETGYSLASTKRFPQKLLKTLDEQSSNEGSVASNTQRNINRLNTTYCKEFNKELKAVDLAPVQPSDMTKQEYDKFYKFNKKLPSVVSDDFMSTGNARRHIAQHPEGINDKDNFVGGTALYHAASKGKNDTVGTLLKAGADVTQQDKYGATALHEAARKGHTETVKTLLEHPDVKKSVNLQDKTGATALHEAARSGRTEAVTMLLNNGAKTDVQDDKGCTPLKLAMDRQHGGAVKALLTASMDEGKDQRSKNSEHLTQLGTKNTAAISAFKASQQKIEGRH